MEVADSPDGTEVHAVTATIHRCPLCPFLTESVTDFCRHMCIHTDTVAATTYDARQRRLTGRLQEEKPESTTVNDSSEIPDQSGQAPDEPINDHGTVADEIELEPFTREQRSQHDQALAEHDISLMNDEQAEQVESPELGAVTSATEIRGAAAADHGISGTSLCCCICSASFALSDDLQAHLMRDHADSALTSILACSACGLVFTDRDALDIHLPSHGSGQATGNLCWVYTSTSDQPDSSSADDSIVTTGDTTTVSPADSAPADTTASVVVLASSGGTLSRIAALPVVSSSSSICNSPSSSVSEIRCSSLHSLTNPAVQGVGSNSVSSPLSVARAKDSLISVSHSSLSGEMVMKNLPSTADFAVNPVSLTPLDLAEPNVDKLGPATETRVVACPPQTSTAFSSELIATSSSLSSSMVIPSGEASSRSLQNDQSIPAASDLSSEGEIQCDMAASRLLTSNVSTASIRLVGQIVPSSIAMSSNGAPMQVIYSSAPSSLLNSVNTVDGVTAGLDGAGSNLPAKIMLLPSKNVSSGSTYSRASSVAVSSAGGVGTSGLSREATVGNATTVFGVTTAQSTTALHQGQQQLVHLVLQCGSCDKLLPHQEALEAHLKSEHNSDAAAQPDLASEEADNDSTTAQISNLPGSVPSSGGGRAFVCGVCGKAFGRREHMGRHMRTHTGERPFGCFTCEKRFSRKVHLESHVRIHTGERPYVCSVCGKAFGRKEHIERHVRIHTGERSFTCGSCGRAFSQKVHLENHARVHTGERPFQCVAYGKAFRRREYMKRHMRTHTGERPFQCATCGKSFRQKSHVDRHTRTHTVATSTSAAIRSEARSFTSLDQKRSALSDHTSASNLDSGGSVGDNEAANVDDVDADLEDGTPEGTSVGSFSVSRGDDDCTFSLEAEQISAEVEEDSSLAQVNSVDKSERIDDQNVQHHMTHGGRTNQDSSSSLGNDDDDVMTEQTEDLGQAILGTAGDVIDTTTQIINLNNHHPTSTHGLALDQASELPITVQPDGSTTQVIHVSPAEMEQIQAAAAAAALGGNIEKPRVLLQTISPSSINGLSESIFAFSGIQSGGVTLSSVAPTSFMNASSTSSNTIVHHTPSACLPSGSSFSAVQSSGSSNISVEGEATNSVNATNSTVSSGRIRVVDVVLTCATCGKACLGHADFQQHLRSHLSSTAGVAGDQQQLVAVVEIDQQTFESCGGSGQLVVADTSGVHVAQLTGEALLSGDPSLSALVSDAPSAPVHNLRLQP